MSKPFKLVVLAAPTIAEMVCILQNSLELLNSGIRVWVSFAYGDGQGSSECTYRLWPGVHALHLAWGRHD